MAVTICHSSIDERGKASGGSAGDQTGREVCTRLWYNKSFNVVLRYKDASLAKKAAAIAKKLADSNLTGYDQGGRNTLYQALKKYNWNVDAYIKSGEKTECDCSSFMFACWCCVLPELRSDGNAPVTSTMRSVFTKHGFTALTDSKYITTDEYLLTGDVLVNESHHTAMAITNGSKSGSVASQNQPQGTSASSATTSSSGSLYTVGKVYTTQVDLNVRTGAGTGYSVKKLSQLTTDGRNHAYEVGNKAVLRANTKVTCLAVKKDSAGNTWIQTPSGWLAAYYSKKWYIK